MVEKFFLTKKFHNKECFDGNRFAGMTEDFQAELICLAQSA